MSYFGTISADFATRCPLTRRWLVEGTVHGVGFDLFVSRLAKSLDLTGYVQSLGGAVAIECQGMPGNLDDFGSKIVSRVPLVMSVRSVTSGPVQTPLVYREFVIRPSLEFVRSADPLLSRVEV